MNYFLYGTHTVEAILLFQSSRIIFLAVQLNFSRLDLLKKARIEKIPVYLWDKNDFKNNLGNDIAHQGVCIFVKPFQYIQLKTEFLKMLSLCVIIDGIEDPGNIGRLARSAFAFGAELLVIKADRSASITAVVEKSAVGALAQIPVARVINLNGFIEQLKQLGIWIIGTSNRGKKNLTNCDLTKKVAIVIGGEQTGIGLQIFQNCDEIVKIPTSGVNKVLNASDSATILLYETIRQRSAQII